MNYTEFIQSVARRPTVLPNQAEPITRATLETLAERISGGQVRELASQLPQELRAYLRKSAEPAETFGLAEFFERVRTRAGMDLQSATAGTRAVLDTLRGAVGGKEYADFVAQLPKEFWELTGPAPSRLETRRVGT